MKRPEGYGGAARTPTPVVEEPRSGLTRPRTPKPQPQKPSVPVVEDPRGSKPRGTSRTPAEEPRGGVSKPRPRRSSAEAELRAARRERRKQEKAELKRFTRRARRRRIAWLTAGGLVVVLAGLLAVAIFSPLLALRTITVEGASRLDPAVLAEAVDGQLGTPLALLDDARITRELGEFALIRSYTTELRPPDTLVIHIVERQPIGVVAAGGAFELVDPAGIVVETSPQRPAGIPLIQLGDAKVGDEAFLAMTEVLRALPSDVLAQVDAVTATTHDDVVLALAGSQQRVVWGSADRSDLKATVFAALLARHGGAGAGEYDVSAPRNPVFRKL